MMRRHGKSLETCETYGRAPGIDGGPYDPRPPRRGADDGLAKGVDFDVFG